MALDELTVSAVVDPEGVRAGLQSALRMVEDFARTATVVVSRADLTPGGLNAGEQAAATLVRGLRTGFEQNQAQLKEMVFRGLISAGRADAIGKTNAAEFNAGLLKGINQLAGSGQLTAKLRVSLVNELKATGLEAGEALRREIANKLVTVDGALSSSGNVATAFGEKATRAASKVAFGLQAVATGGAGAEAGLKGVLGAASNFAGMFGNGGLIVAAVAAGSLAIVNYFSKARDEMAKTRKKFIEEIDAIENAGEGIGLTKRLQSIDLGTPAARGADSLIQLKRQRDELNALLRGQSVAASSTDARQGGGVDPASAIGQLIRIRQAALRAIKPKIDALEAERRELVRRINSPPDPRREVKLGETIVTGKGDKQLATDAASATAKALRASEKAARDFVDGLQAVAAAAQLSGKGAEHIEGINERLVASYKKVSDAIAAQKDHFGPYAVELRKVREELEKSPLIKMLNGEMPGLNVGITPRINLTEGGFLGSPIANVAGSRATPPALPKADFSRFDLAVAYVSNGLRDIGTSLSAMGKKVLDDFTPAGLAVFTFGAVLKGAAPFLEALKEPLRIVGEILGKALAPILKALFPIFKGVAIAATYVGEIFFKVSSVLTLGIGYLIRGIGNLLNKLPGSIGNPLKKAGQELIDFGHAQREAADALRKGRDELRNLEWNDALDNVTGAANEAAEALRNVPQGWNAALAAFEAGRLSPGDTPAGGGKSGGKVNTGSGDTGGGNPGGGSGGGTGTGGGRGRFDGEGDGPAMPTTIIIESVKIGDNLTPKQQARFFLNELRDISADQFGTSSRVMDIR